MTEDRKKCRDFEQTVSSVPGRRSPVGSEAAIRSARRGLSGAISVERMDFMDAMDVPELTPSREKTENTPVNPVFGYPIGFEVKRKL